ncbi:hypothetical protein H4R35_002742 [Dimargaris xerosporica]|nr:hypothetical protein H4R35_002742 [Dimargaris xerosporica]
MEHFQTTTAVYASSRPGKSLSVKFYRPTVSASVPSRSSTPVALIFCHAVGFNKESWEPLIENLPLAYHGVSPQPTPAERECTPIPRQPWSSDSARAQSLVEWHIDHLVTFDAWNHGDSALLNNVSTKAEFNGTLYAQDLLALVKQLNVAIPLIAVGVSMGSATILTTELLQPSTFAAIFAIDPVTPFQPPKLLAFQTELARRRKDTWATWGEIKQDFSRSKVFKTFDPRVLEVMLQTSVYKEESSGQLRLKCRPAHESFTYQACLGTLILTLSRLSEILCPVRFLLGEKSTMFPNPAIIRNTVFSGKLFDGWLIKDTGHLVSMETPHTAGAQLARFIGPALAWRLDSPMWAKL